MFYHQSSSSVPSSSWERSIWVTLRGIKISKWGYNMKGNICDISIQEDEEHYFYSTIYISIIFLLNIFESFILTMINNKIKLKLSIPLFDR